jgi:hypothetical protein
VIPGYFDPALPTWPRPLIRVTLYLPGISRRWAPVDFLLDTGAATSCVHPQDAITRLGIDAQALRTPSAWPLQQAAHGVGGATIDYMVPIQFALRHDDGSWDRYQHDLAIARPGPANQTLPSLLGWDILRHYRVVVDWPSRGIRLETP